VASLREVLHDIVARVYAGAEAEAGKVKAVIDAHLADHHALLDAAGLAPSTPAPDAPASGAAGTEGQADGAQP
jgi:hypothetical protein